MSARIEDVLAEHETIVACEQDTDEGICICGGRWPWDNGDLFGGHRKHIAEMLRDAGLGDVARARKDALLEAADDAERFADETYSPRIFRRPTKQDYAAINDLLQRERGHMLDGVAADCYSRAIHVQAARLRVRAADEVES